jgi:hypothetical protein
VDIELAIAGLVKATSEQAAETKRMRETFKRLVLQGRRVNLTSSLTVTASGPQVMDFGAVPVGFLWEVKNFLAGPADLSAGGIPAGITSYLFGGTFGGPKAADYSPNALLGWTAQYPAQGYYGTHETFVSGSEHLYVLFTGATVGTVIFGSALVLQSPLDTTERIDL